MNDESPPKGALDSTNDDTEPSRILPGGCSDCGREWAAMSEAHCAICHEHFSSDKAFDRHLLAPGAEEPCTDPATCNLYLVLRASGPAWSAERPLAMSESTFRPVPGRVTTDA